MPDKSVLSFDGAQDGEPVEPLPLDENSISTAFRKSRYYAVISTGAMRSPPCHFDRSDAQHRAAEKSLLMTYRVLRIVALFMKRGSSTCGLAVAGPLAGTED